MVILIISPEYLKLITYLPTRYETLDPGNESIWNLGKSEYDPRLVRDYALNMGGANQIQTFTAMMREFALPMNIAFSEFIRGGHFETLLSLLNQENWPKDIDYGCVMRNIIRRDDVQNFVRLLRGFEEHGLSVETPKQLLPELDHDYAKDIFKWLKIHELLPINT